MGRAFPASKAVPFKARPQEDSILVSIAAYRDNGLHTTLRDIVGRAKRPERVFVGLVQQTCTGRSGACKTGVLADGSVQSTGPDEDTKEAFCSEERYKSWCKTNMRAVKVEEEDSLGPTLARFLASKLWMGETYFMQVDAHVRLAPSWDDDMIRQLKGAMPSKKNAILSAYPEPGWSDSTSWVNQAGPRMCDAYFAQQEGDILRIGGSSTFEDSPAARPVPTPWIAAGYFFAPGQFLEEVPFDPLSPWVFMGEELSLTARAWTSGYDVFAPNATLLTHWYERRHLPKFWETVGRAFDNPGAHNALQFYIVQRTKHMTGYEAHDAKQKTSELLKVDPGFLDGLEDTGASSNIYGLGKERSLPAFLDHVGIDMATSRTWQPSYCTRRWPSHDDGSWERL
eukprot:TRINITY_DN9497_c0_g1_i2.p1 TRINITY_DN9497_c0_g1~~TRINITY_DN9497_c0_g1_i2.p1  ORF type:complete len:397 (-),score=92.74 TRINITY_DN9497_c0_g1_i2:134-1324(-)